MSQPHIPHARTPLKGQGELFIGGKNKAFESL